MCSAEEGGVQREREEVYRGQVPSAKQKEI